MPMATAENTMGLHFDVGDEVIEVMGSGEKSKKFRTRIARVLNDRVCAIEGGREYDRLTGAPIPTCVAYRAIHTAGKYKHVKGEGAAT